LTPRLEAAGGVANRFEMWTRWGWIRHPDVSARHGYNIRRQVLDPMLRSMAAETPGVTFLPGLTVSDVLMENGRIVGVRTQEGHSGPRRSVPDWS
jgi:flavin-dependent dehydrogenase